VFGGLPPKEGPLSKGYFAIPTVFADTSNDWRLAREEIFGPVLVAIPWREEEDAIRMANDSHYGLAAYVWTYEIGSALRTAHAIESGWVQGQPRAGPAAWAFLWWIQAKRHWPGVLPGRHAGQFHSAEERHG
jgi:acyl-CoA reductase-like NAD-dependent aldehyde dehydrogenase